MVQGNIVLVVNGLMRAVESLWQVATDGVRNRYLFEVVFCTSVKWMLSSCINKGGTADDFNRSSLTDWIFLSRTFYFI